MVMGLFGKGINSLINVIIWAHLFFILVCV